MRVPPRSRLCSQSIFALHQRPASVPPPVPPRLRPIFYTRGASRLCPASVPPLLPIHFLRYINVPPRSCLWSRLGPAQFFTLDARPASVLPPSRLRGFAGSTKSVFKKSSTWTRSCLSQTGAGPKYYFSKYQHINLRRHDGNNGDTVVRNSVEKGCSGAEEEEDIDMYLFMRTSMYVSFKARVPVWGAPGTTMLV